MAVLSVVFYHLGWSWIEGGFVGVDVFFVISGFLITGIIKRGTEQGTFNYWQFSVGRVRRLYPALVVTLAVAFAVGAWILSPAHLKEFARSTLWALGSASNFFFLQGKGYWGTAQEFQPLLHTWSLGVEVQFYVVWPLFIWTVVKYLSPRNAFLAVIAAALASLALAEYWIAIDSAAQANPRAFFLMPARIVEFAIGGALVWFIDRRPSDARLAEAMTASGAIMIVASVLTYTEAMHFPGWTALVPCIGTALIIYAGGPARWAGWIFRSAPAVYVGNISYALYLVHWPIIVFYSYYKFFPRTLLDDAIIIALCFALAALLHVVIEKPFQGKTLWRIPLSAPALLGGVAAIIAVVALPASLAMKKGWPERVPEANQKWLMQASSRGDDKSGAKKAKKAILLAGDSHAGHFRPLVSAYAKSRGLRLDFLPGRCLPLLGVTRIVDGNEVQRCKSYGAQLEAAMRFGKYEAVFVAARWSTTLNGGLDAYEAAGIGDSFFLKETGSAAELNATTSLAAFEVGLSNLVNAATRAKSRLVILGQAPPLGIDLGPCLMRRGDDCHPYYTRAEAYERIRASNEAISSAVRGSGSRFINSFAIMCPKRAEYCPAFSKKTFLYRDDDHLNYDGARSLLGRFAPLFDKAIKDGGHPSS